MKLAALLVIVLSNQGYWLSGQPGSINLRPAIASGLPDAVVVWELKLGNISLAQGKTALADHDQGATIKLIPPAARVRLTLHWLYRVVSHDGKKELAAGDVPIHLFPPDLMDGIARRVGHKKLAVWDDAGALSGLLDQAKVPSTHLSAKSNWDFVEADVLLVERDALSDSAFVQSPLWNLAEAGASVMIFQQTRPHDLMGFSLTRRSVPSKLGWRLDHPLLADFEGEDLQSWVPTDLMVPFLQLPADGSALEIASYPPEVTGETSIPTDALLLTKTIGKGRIVLCQIPLGDWKDDPRSQIFLRNSIDYLLTRPQPMPPNRKPEKLAREPKSIPCIR